VTQLHEDWARCREWIRAAVEPTGLYQIGDVEQAIASGEMHFWPGKHCAAVTEFIFYPNCKHGSCLNLSYMQMPHVLLEEHDAIPAN